MMNAVKAKNAVAKASAKARVVGVPPTPLRRVADSSFVDPGLGAMDVYAR